MLLLCGETIRKRCANMSGFVSIADTRAKSNPTAALNSTCAPFPKLTLAFRNIPVSP